MAVLDWLYSQLGGNSDQPDSSSPPQALDYLKTLLGGGDPEAQGQAAASTAMAPVTGGIGGAIAGDVGDLAQGLWGGTVKMPGQILAGERAPTVADTTSFALNTLPVRGALGTIKAYHGSPYDFSPEPGAPLGRFRDDKIGTGEGAQAYAYGHYGAEAEPVAQGYRDGLSQSALQIGDQKIIPPRGSPEDIALAHLEDAFYKQSSSPYAMALQSLRNVRDLTPETPTMAARNTMESAMKVLGDWQETGAKPVPAGKMYELNINAEPDQFLNWDTPATAQPPNVQDALGKIWQQLGGATEGRQYPPFAAHPEATGESLHAALATALGSKEAAAAALRDAGVPGVSYLDAGSRRFPAMYQADLIKTKADVADLSGALKTTQDALGSVEPGSRAHNALSIDALNHSSNLETAQARLDQLLKNPVEGTSNYVVFDPSIIEILRKYGLAGLTAAGGATALGGTAQAAPNDPLSDIMRRLGGAP